MKMRPFAVLAVAALACGLAAPARAEGDLAIADALALVKKAGSDGRRPLLLRVYVKNTGKAPVTVLTRELQTTLMMHEGAPWEVSMDLSASPLVDDKPVVPSLYAFQPVTLQPGEVAEVRHFYLAPAKLTEKVVATYDMLNEWSDRFHTWRGRIRTEPLAPIEVPVFPVER